MMSEVTIQCPKCGKTIPLSEAVSRQVEERARADLEEEENRLRKEFERQLSAKEHEYQAKLAEQRAELEKRAARQAKDAVAVEVKDLEERVREQERAIEGARKQELALRKRARELEDKERALAVDVQRRIDEERETVRAQVRSESLEEQHLKDRERDKIESDLKKRVADLQQKLEQGSQQLQGEVAELELEDVLRMAFPLDDIRPIQPGRKGGDLLHEVRSPLGRPLGLILWESKRTKDWGAQWLEKVKEDQRNSKADLAAIISKTLPPSLAARRFGELDGVWVAQIELVVGLATALRSQIVAVGSLRTAQEGKGDRMGVLYDYLTGAQFKTHVQAIIETFVRMKTGVEREKRALTRAWAVRERQIATVLESIIGLHSDLEVISGGALPAIKLLELPEEVETEDGA